MQCIVVNWENWLCMHCGQQDDRRGRVPGIVTIFLFQPTAEVTSRWPKPAARALS
jgi:hypothetical protein